MTRLDQLKQQLAARRGQRSVDTKDNVLVRAEETLRASVRRYKEARIAMLIRLEDEFKAV